MLYEIENAYKAKRNKKRNNLLAYSKKDKVYYVNKAFGFDIETCSWINKEGEKRAHLVSYGLYLGEYKIGRSWQALIDELKQFERGISEIGGGLIRAIIWVHNLSYEMQFMLRRLYEIEPITELLALDNRKPLRFLWGSLEFRCSYLLSGKSLARIGKDLGYYKSMDWDYNLQRNSNTPLTKEEAEYQIKDVEIMIKFIEDEIKGNGGRISEIPLTKTGYVRREIKNLGNKSPTFRAAMAALPIRRKDYFILYRAFMGGYVHASKQHIGKVLENVTSCDIVSSYPSVMIAEKFPKKLIFKDLKLSRKTIETGEKFGYLYVFRATFTNIVAKKGANDFYLSLHKTRTTRSGQDSKLAMCKFDRVGEKTKIFNGRIEQHYGELKTFITNIDLQIIDSCYTYNKLEIDSCYVYESAYLPHEYFKLIMRLYDDKNNLKGVEGKQFEYNKSKEMLNSMYGMTVEQVLKDEITFNGAWCVKDAATLTADEIDEILADETNKKSRFRHFSWGVFVTAYARRNLWAAINALGDDYIYSDTDSVKFLNYEKHKEFFASYNKKITEKVRRGLEARHIFNKKTTLGTWDFEGTYAKFKTLGAKRYLYELDDKLHLTCAGLSKKTVGYIEKNGGFDFFDCGMCIPKKETSKKIHFYGDESFIETHMDYMGNVAKVSEYSFIHLEDANFELNTESYVLQTIRNNKNDN